MRGVHHHHAFNFLDPFSTISNEVRPVSPYPSNHIQAYSTISNQISTISNLVNHILPCPTISSYIQPYQTVPTIPNHVQTCLTIADHTLQYPAISNYIQPYLNISSHIKPPTISNHIPTNPTISMPN
jgi:hypothetical protein